MALKLGELFYDFNADTSKLKRKQKEILNTNKKLNKSFGGVGRAITAAFSFEVLRRAALLADSTKLLDVRIKNVTKSQREFNRAQKELLRISNQTGTALENNVRLFEAFTIAGDQLGATNNQVLKLTENINKLGIIGGSSQDALGNATLQLGQALAGGIVRAEEFNSIIENTPLIAKAIADGFGLSIGELHKMVLEGRLLSEDVFKNILGQTDEIEKKFATIPLTIERASTEFANNLGQALKDVDSIAGVTSAIAVSIQKAANILKTDFKSDTADIVILYKEWLRDAKNLITELSSGFRLVGAQLSALTAFSDEGKRITEQNIARIRRERDVTIAANNAIIASEIKKIEAKKGKKSFSVDTSLIPGGNSGDVGNTDNIGSSGPQTTQVSGVDKMRAQMGDETQIILNALLERNNKILELTDASEKEKRDLLIESAKLTNKELLDLENRNNLTRIESMRAANDSIITVLKLAGKERTAVGKIALAADIAMAIQSAFVSIGTNVAKSSEIGFPQNIPMIAGAIAQGAGIISTIQKAKKGGGRQHGGIASGGMIHPVNENGNPEMFQQGARQFLMAPPGGGKVIPMNQASNDSSPKITINNSMGGVADVSVSSVSRDEVIMMVKQAENNAVGRVDSSLSQGRGSSAQALKQGFKTERNIR